ncbi:MAG: hypothetical protein M0C28_42825 [Candidatus Moduliflexus flocculans]|nr:hypothetical protein [Candidatus Moduliflexus flocculans]
MKKAAALVTGEEFVEGAVDEIVFYNPDNGYTVAKFLPEAGEPMTVVGAFPPLSPGEVLRVHGGWELNPALRPPVQGRPLHHDPAGLGQGHREVPGLGPGQGHRPGPGRPHRRRVRRRDDRRPEPTSRSASARSAASAPSS